MDWNEWVDVVVIGVDEKGYFQVSGSSPEIMTTTVDPRFVLRLFSMPRILLYLLNVFCRKTKSKGKIKHEIFVDCMPNEDVTTLRPE